MSSRIFLLGIPIDSVSQKEAVDSIKSFLASDSQHHIVTPNSEMLVEASRNPIFHSMLQRSSLNLPDSAGLLFAAKWTGQKLKERVAGVDTVKILCKELTSDVRIYLLGADEGIADSAAQKLLKENPNLNVVGTFSGSPNPSDSENIIRNINEANPSLLLVAYGAPAQDMWIDEHLASMPSVKVAMGVGGTFDFLSGKVKRAPVVFQKLRLEWLWRVILEPRRVKRIFTAVIVFPFLILIRGRKG